MANILDWAKREVEIACKKENPNRKERKFDYGCACYASALKAFESLCEDGHSGYSIRITQSILNRLIDGMPLTPIEDTDDIWDLMYESDNEKLYQCERMSALFKYVNKDGSVTYDCNDHCYCIDINGPNNTYSSGLVRRIIHEMYPIKMPYMPGKPIKVYCEDFLYDKNNGDFDTMGIFYAVKEDNDGLRTIHINKFFREPFKNELESPNYPGWVEISEAEYMRRKASKIERGKNELR